MTQLLHTLNDFNYMETKMFGSVFFGFFCLPPTCCLEHNPETSLCLLLFGFVCRK